MLSALPHPLIVPIGLVMGILIAAPVGPVNVLCVQRAIERGVMGGIAAGLGAVLGDGLIAFLAAWGVGSISGAISRYRDTIQLVGGLVVIAFGILLAFSTPRLSPAIPIDEDWAHFGDYLWDVPKTFLLTIANPGAVLGLFAIFGGVSSFLEVGSTLDALLLVASVMAGSLAWWIALSMMIGRIRHRIDAARLRHINIGAGALLVVFGFVLLGELAWKAIRLAWLGGQAA